MMKKLITLVLAVMLALSAVAAFATEYSDKDTVKKVQQALNDAGYDCGTPDGAAGKKTKAAITSYQTDKGLTVTGVIDDELLVSLGLAEAKADEAETGEVEETSDGYTFQGIPWGSSPEEVQDILVENGIIGQDTNLYVNDQRSFCMPGPDTPNKDTAWDSVVWWPCNTFDGVGGMSSIHGDETLKTIGGFEVNNISFGFLYTIKDEQIVQEMHLDSVVICFVDSEMAFNGLNSSLESAYGTHKKQESLGTFAYDSKTLIWEGENNTAILLTVIGDDTVTLSYVKTDAYITVEKLLEIIKGNKPVLEDAGL